MSLIPPTRVETAVMSAIMNYLNLFLLQPGFIFTGKSAVGYLLQDYAMFWHEDKNISKTIDFNLIQNIVT